MPILIKGSGGVQETPVISVSSSGLITATAGDEKTTKQLSSSYDSDFVASNIKSGVNIFGVTGTMEAVTTSAVAYGNGTSSIQFSLDGESISETDDLVSVFLFYRGGARYLESGAVVAGYSIGNAIDSSLTTMSFTLASGATGTASLSFATDTITITANAGGNHGVFYQTDDDYVLLVSYIPGEQQNTIKPIL